VGGRKLVLRRMCGPGGMGGSSTLSLPGYISPGRTEERDRSSSISARARPSRMYAARLAGIVYDYIYQGHTQGHTIEERWTSIVVDSDFVSALVRYSLMSVRSSIVASVRRGTCDKIMTQVDEDRAGDVGVDGPITCQPG
jgi:hypothetical protein